MQRHDDDDHAADDDCHARRASRVSTLALSNTAAAEHQRWHAFFLTNKYIAIATKFITIATSLSATTPASMDPMIPPSSEHDMKTLPATTETVTHNSDIYVQTVYVWMDATEQ